MKSEQVVDRLDANKANAGRTGRESLQTPGHSNCNCNYDRLRTKKPLHILFVDTILLEQLSVTGTTFHFPNKFTSDAKNVTKFKHVEQGIGIGNDLLLPCSPPGSAIVVKK